MYLLHEQVVLLYLELIQDYELMYLKESHLMVVYFQHLVEILIQIKLYLQPLILLDVRCNVFHHQ